MCERADEDLAGAGRLLQDTCAQVRREYGRFLIKQGRPAEARVQLQKAREFFDHPLARYERDQIDALLEHVAVA